MVELSMKEEDSYLEGYVECTGEGTECVLPLLKQQKHHKLGVQWLFLTGFGGCYRDFLQRSHSSVCSFA